MKKQKNCRANTLNAVQRQMVAQNLTLTENLSKRYAGLGESRGIERQDLQQEAALALCEAALRYDPTKGADFRTYAYDWCKGRIRNYIKRQPETVPDAELPYGIDTDDDRKDVVFRVEKLMSELSDTERQIVYLIYGIEGDPMDFREVSLLLRLSTRRVHCIYERAMVKIEAKAAVDHEEIRA